MKYIILILIAMTAFPAFSQKNYESVWKKVDSLSNLGQARSALEIADQIFNETRAENNAPQFLKAVLYRMALKSGFEEEFLENAISSTEGDIAEARPPVKNILHSVLAGLYWRYYQDNRYKFLSRTETTGFPETDIRSWDLRKIVQECVRNYSLSLENPGLLKQIKPGEYDAILLQHPETRRFRPTLFDFLAHQAIDFYSNSEAGLTQPAARFLVEKSEYFGSSEIFSSLRIETPDTLSFEYNAMRLLQQLVAFHAPDQDPAALADAEIRRLKFVHEHCVLPEKDSLFLSALQNLEKRFAGQPCSADVVYETALQLVSGAESYHPLESPDHKWDLKKAYSLAGEAVRQFPGTEGANNCRTLLEQISGLALDISTDYASVPGKPFLALVNYKNIPGVQLRLVRIDPMEDRNLNEAGTNKALHEYLGSKAEKSWWQALPDDGDHQSHKAEIKLPALDPGFYALLASPDQNFSPDTLISLNRFWSTRISYINRRNDDGSNEVFVLDRQEGQPLEKVRVQSFSRNYDYNSRKYLDVPGQTLITGKNGYVSIPAEKKDRNNQFYLVFGTDKNQFITESYFFGFNYGSPEVRTYVSTHFFTDRAIYRPGQTIYFKGIVVEHKGDEVKIKAGTKSLVTFFDVNGQKVSSLNLITNEFGSFAGSFTAPQGVLTGQMSIQCETGDISIQVEEYKRPKFEVTFKPLEGSYKLGETVTVTGKAMAFSGNPAADASVKYRVMRRARFPYMWWGWQNRMPESPAMEITNGLATTNEQGEFTIPFRAIADPTVDRKFDPVFNYTVFATVTDLNGETHDGETSVEAGYKALIIKTDLAKEINLDSLFEFPLSATNLSGQKQNVQGQLIIWKLNEPGRLLRKRNWNRPDCFTMSRQEFEKDFPFDIYDNEGDITAWEKQKQVFAYDFDTRTDSVIRPGIRKQAGSYLVEIKTSDAFGQAVETKTYFAVFLPSSGELPGNNLSWFNLPARKAEPGETVQLFFGSSAKKTHMICEVSGKNLDTRRTFPETDGLQQMSLPVTENCRGGFSVNLAFVKYNRSFQYNGIINVPYTNKKLDIRFASFRSKLEPGQKEEWQISIKGSKGEKALAELMAGMYDASLDAFVPHSWDFDLYSSYWPGHPWEVNTAFASRGSVTAWQTGPGTVLKYREYDQLNWFGMQDGMYLSISDEDVMKSEQRVPSGAVLKQSVRFNAPVIKSDSQESEAHSYSQNSAGEKGIPVPPAKPVIRPAEPLSPKIRTDFNETAFFYPQISTNESGDLVLKFTMPESLTRWKMMGLATTRDLKIGQVEKTLVTQKDLMVFPNAPRFFREGDKMQFSTKISNISDRPLKGTVELHFFDALSMKSIDELMNLSRPVAGFETGAGSGRLVSWDIHIPEGLQAVVYRVSASSGSFSDGEEAAVPILTNRMLVTESMPIPVNGNQSKTFTFEKLLASGTGSCTLRNYRLSLEFTSNPAWYAVQALPYLMEYPYECAEQVFSRFYANSLATHIANSDPNIRKVFESWKALSPDALKSNLEKNQELKSILIEESPWVREAADESERKQRLGILLDLNHMSGELESALKKLNDMQSTNGGWPWFPGMPDNRYITQHILTGLGHLDHLGVGEIRENEQTWQMLLKAVKYLDARLAEDFLEVKRQDKDYLKNNHLGTSEIQYLYARSYFMADFPIGKETAEAFGYYKEQAVTGWKQQNNYMKGMIALALERFKELKAPKLIMRSLSETALHNEETGMYWRNEQAGWFWYQSPVETQALLIEAYDEVMNDTKSVDELKVWLLKQKQTRDWKTTKATTEAVYALLLRGSNLLASDRPATMKVGDEFLDPSKLEGSSRPEAGTGYFKTSWDGGSIKPGMGKVTVTNPNATVAWGAMYWQYFEQLDKITRGESPLSVSKKLFREKNTAGGPVIEPVSDTSHLKLGDRLVVRIELRTDRDMEFVHLKDMRAAAFEPLNVLSGYRYQDGLGYYEATRDASSNFFIGYLPKGSYIFEYRLNATQKGEFSNGVTSVQCMYAPEFAAHSEGIRVKVD